MTVVMITDPENKPHEGVCPNCSAELVGPYCAVCGQHQVDLERPLRALLGEAMDSFLDFDERILRTLTPLITRPGLLTVEFLAGRRKRYVHPFKLYFALSLALFLALSMWGYTVVQVAGDDRIVVTTEGMTTGVELKRSEGSVQAEAPSFLDWLSTR